MRVAIFSDTDRFAGTERHILDLARGMHQEGGHALVACPPQSPLAVRSAAEGIDVTPLSPRGLLDRGALAQVRHLFDSGAADLVHVHNGRTALLCTLALRNAKRGCCVLTMHFIEPAHLAMRGPSALLHRLAHRWVNSRIAHFIAVSEAVRQAILQRGQARAQKITLIPNGIPMPDLTTLTAAKKVREDLGVAPETPLLVCAARLESEKDVGSLVVAMAKVTMRYPQAVAVVAGEGSLRPDLQAQIRQLQLDHCVRLLGFRSDVLSIMQAGDVFVLPSLAEPFGLVVIEAMALGKPVVSTRAGGPLEIVREGETGLLVPPSQPDLLADALLQMLANSQAAQEMGRQGQLRFQQKFTAERMVRDTYIVYQQALCARS